MIGMDVAAFVESPVMIVVSTRGSNNRAYIGRGSGARFDRASGHIDLLVCRSQWSDVTANAIKDAPIAVTYVRPNDYRALQIKGWIQAVATASADEQKRSTAYVERMLAVMENLGVTRLQLSHTLTDADLCRISYIPTDLFEQTPGPAAGKRLQGDAPS